MNTILIVGSGRQSQAVIEFLSAIKQYNVLVFTRNTVSDTAKRIAALPNVELVPNTANSGYDTSAFTAVAKRADFVFINIDGFALGEMADTYWGIRLFQLASGAGVKHVVYSGLDYNQKEVNFDPNFYVGHYEGKARVQEWMKAQGTSPTAWTIIRTGPYAAMLSENQPLAPARDADGTYIYNFPLKDGAIPLIHLEDLAGYVHWALTHRDRSSGLDLGIAIAHVTGPELAAAFTSTTGKPAKYVDTPTDVWNAITWAKLPKGTDTKIGFQSVKDDNALLLTYSENFTNWWHLYQVSGKNEGLIKRDYKLLDEILPTRVKSIEEWMKKVGHSVQFQ